MKSSQKVISRPSWWQTCQNVIRTSPRRQVLASKVDVYLFVLKKLRMLCVIRNIYVETHPYVFCFTNSCVFWRIPHVFVFELHEYPNLGPARSLRRGRRPLDKKLIFLHSFLATWFCFNKFVPFPPNLCILPGIGALDRGFVHPAANNHMCTKDTRVATIFKEIYGDLKVACGLLCISRSTLQHIFLSHPLYLADLNVHCCCIVSLVSLLVFADHSLMEW